MRSAKWQQVALVFLVATAWDCGDKALMALSAVIKVSPDTLAFGQGQVGSPQQIRVSVTNDGSAPLTIDSIKLATDPSGELAVEDKLTTDCEDVGRSGSPNLEQGECARFTVIWTPRAAHGAQGSVEIDSNDEHSSVVTLPVTGSASAPALQVCVLKTDGTVDAGQCSDLSASPSKIPTVDFGNGLADGAPLARTVRLTNLGLAPLLFGPAPALSSTTPPDFSMVGAVPGNRLAAGASADLTFTARPRTNGVLLGALVLATNDTRAAKVEVPLQIFVAGWKLCVDPAAGLDFGTVTIGQTQKLTLTLTNCGSADFQITQFKFGPFAPTTTQFTIPGGQLPAAPSTFAVGAQTKLDVSYKPTAERVDTASVDYQLTLSDGRTIQDTIPIKGHGQRGACGTVGAANPIPKVVASFSAQQNGTYAPFDPNASLSPVLPLYWVKLNASSSTVSGGTVTYTWQLVSQPPGSTTSLLGTGVQVSLQTLVSGVYGVSLTVKDAAGCVGTLLVNINVVPAGDIHVELTWAEAYGDIDLHYTAPGASFCDDGRGDLSYLDIGSPPDWGCSNASCSPRPGNGNSGGWHPDGVALDDASLDHDDLSGYGPENVTQKQPFDSPAGKPYRIYVYYYGANGGGTAHPTVHVYLKGALTNTFKLTSGIKDGQLWYVGDIDVTSQAASLQVTGRDTAAKAAVPSCRN